MMQYIMVFIVTTGCYKRVFYSSTITYHLGMLQLLDIINCYGAVIITSVILLKCTSTLLNILFRIAKNVNNNRLALKVQSHFILCVHLSKKHIYIDLN